MFVGGHAAEEMFKDDGGGEAGADGGEDGTEACCAHAEGSEEAEVGGAADAGPDVDEGLEVCKGALGVEVMDDFVVVFDEALGGEGHDGEEDCDEGGDGPAGVGRGGGVSEAGAWRKEGVGWS